MSEMLTSIRKRFYRLRRRPVIAERHGALLRLDPRDLIDNRLLARAPYEDAQIAAARSVIIRRQLDLVFDIGANIGLYSVVLGLLPQVRSIVAFEPVTRNHDRLCRNLELNGLSGRSCVHKVAVGARPGRAEIHIAPRSTGLSRLDRATAGRNSKVFTERETIVIVRFDDVVSVRGRRAFVKIDVEGHAIEVVEGMSEFLAHNEVALQIELSASERERSRALLALAGYRESRQIEGDHLFEPAAWAV